MSGAAATQIAVSDRTGQICLGLIAICSEVPGGGDGAFASTAPAERTRLWLPAIYSLGRLADLHAALEEGAIADTDALGNHIPDQGTFTADSLFAGSDGAAPHDQRKVMPTRAVINRAGEERQTFGSRISSMRGLQECVQSWHERLRPALRMY
jgi:hypothetical protein